MQFNYSRLGVRAVALCRAGKIRYHTQTFTLRAIVSPSKS